MVRLITLVLIVLSSAVATKAFAQENRPENPRHENPVIQGVQEHVDRLCAAHDKRQQALTNEEALLEEIAAARARFLQLLDLPLDEARQPPPVHRVGRIEGDGYWIEKIIIESAPGVPVPCNLYVPKKGPQRKPTLIIPHGHGGRDYPSGQNAYQRFAKAGFLVLAKDGWGKQERRSTGHETHGGHLFLTGASLMALELFDNARCIDYLLTRDDVDPERLGMTGSSGGGSQTLFCAAVEKRLAAASPTCSATSLRADLADTDMCICELLPDLLTVGDHSLFLAMAYPRPILVVNGIQDYIFPINGARASVREARRLYALGGHADRMRLAEFPAPHSWNDAMLAEQIRFFRKAFDLPPLEELPLGDEFRSYAMLECYPGGDMPADAQTLADLHRSRIERFHRERAKTHNADRSQADLAHLDAIVRQRWSGDAVSPSKIARKSLGPDRAARSTREQWTWQSGLGGEVSIEISTPLDKTLAVAARKHLVLRLHGDRETDRMERYYWNDRVRTHAIVVELTYTGKSLTTHQTTQVATALLASGRSLLAERVRDILVALQVVDDAGLVDDDAQLTLVGHHYDGPLLLAAAPWLPERSHLVLDRSPVTYRIGSELDMATEELAAETAHWNVMPHLAERLDLADLLELTHPRRITLFHPLNAARQPLSRSAWQELAKGIGLRDPERLRVLGVEARRVELMRLLNQSIASDAPQE